MALILKPLRCPHCKQPMDKRLLRRSQQLQAFLQRKPFSCPHCEASVVCPETSDTIISIGLFIAVLLAPIFHLSDWNFIDSFWLFGLGVAMILAGGLTQKLIKA